MLIRYALSNDKDLAEKWIIHVRGKEYGPADLDTFDEWKDDGRVLPANPARQVDIDMDAVGSAKDADWKTAADIPGLFEAERPPVQREVTDQRSEVISPQSAIRDQQSVSKPPSRNVLVETFRIYFRGFFQ